MNQSLWLGNTDTPLLARSASTMQMPHLIHLAFTSLNKNLTVIITTIVNGHSLNISWVPQWDNDGFLYIWWILLNINSERQLVRKLTCEVGCAHCAVNCAQTAICALLMTTSVIRRGWQCVIHHFRGSHALRLYSTTLSSRLIFNLIISFLSPSLHSAPGSEGGPTRIRCATA